MLNLLVNTHRKVRRSRVAKSQSCIENITPTETLGPWSLRTLFALILLVAGVPCAAAAAEITDVVVGFVGQYRVGRWTPVRLSLQASESPVRDLRTCSNEGKP